MATSCSCYTLIMSQNVRVDEEQATQKRARLLNLDYFDTSLPAEKVLYRDMLPLMELYQKKIIPLNVEKGLVLFGIVNTTSQQTIREFKQRFGDRRVTFAMISDAGYREYMRLYDPPKKIEYQDIKIAETNQQATLDRISNTLQQVRSDDILAYLVQQAFRLKASDIHLENQACRLAWFLGPDAARDAVPL